jgi:hypothetical protein
MIMKNRFLFSPPPKLPPTNPFLISPCHRPICGNAVLLTRREHHIMRNTFRQATKPDLPWRGRVSMAFICAWLPTVARALFLVVPLRVPPSSEIKYTTKHSADSQPRAASAPWRR